MKAHVGPVISNHKHLLHLHFQASRHVARQLHLHGSVMVEEPAVGDITGGLRLSPYSTLRMVRPSLHNNLVDAGIEICLLLGLRERGCH